ncbi:MAG TPA: TetR/AcrR family transcriptional regulator [Solirubrobacteraceae bacterium]
MSSPVRRLPPEQRREQLLDVLTDIIVEEGYAAVSIDRVARTAGIARTVVYAQFENLDGMFAALVDRTQMRALGQVSAVIPEIGIDRDPDEILVEAIRMFTTLVRDHPRTWRLVLFPAEGAPRLVRERIEEGRVAVRALLEPVLSWGIAKRGGPTIADTDLTARLIVGLGEEMARLVLSDAERYSPDRMADYVGTLMAAIGRA